MRASVKSFPVIVHGEPLMLTSETITKTRRVLADLHKQIVADATSGKVKVNERYIKEFVIEHRHAAALTLVGKNDHSLYFVQAAVMQQTGVCVPMMFV